MSNIETVSHKDFFNSPAVKGRFQEVLKGKENQFVASLLSVVTNNNLLARASNQSIMTAAMKAAVLDLSVEPSLGYAYIVPYGKDAQFQLGYKGLIQLAQRSGKYKSINAGVVYKSQLVSYNPLFEELEIDFTQPADEIVGYFAAFKLLNGFEKILYWTKEQAEAHGRRFSKTYTKGPWSSDFDAMAQKTVLKQIISKYGPLSVEMQDAITADNETEDVKGSIKQAEPIEEQSLSDMLQDSEVVVSKTKTTTDTSYPAEEIPDFDEETGEVFDGEQGNLFGSLAEVTS